MHYSNEMPTRKINYKTVNFANFKNGINSTSDEFSLPITTSKNTYNFDFKNGALSKGLGVSEVSVSMIRGEDGPYKNLTYPSGVDVLACWTYDNYMDGIDFLVTTMIIYCSDGYLYNCPVQASNGGFTIIGEKHFTEIPSAIKYKLNDLDVMIFSTPNEGMYVYSDTSYTKDTNECPAITSMVEYNDRLFATVAGEKISIWYSNDLDPTNWNVSSGDAGYINLIDERGPLYKIIQFKDYLYVFREYGISKIVSYNNETSFSVSHLFLSSTKIYTNTVCVCGDVVYMLLSDGVYAFDGVNCEKINLNIENILRANEDAVASYHNGKYYLACLVEFSDDNQIGCEEGSYVNNALLEIDILNETFNIMRGVDITYLYSSMDVSFALLFCVYHTNGTGKLGMIENTGKVINEILPKYWCSPITNLDAPNKDKILKEVCFNANQETEVEVQTEKNTKKFVVTPVNKLAIVKPNMIGKQYSISFKVLEDTCYVSGVSINVGYFE